MISYLTPEIANITGGKNLGRETLTISNIITDSRNSESTNGSMFVAIKGKQHDSHCFVEEMYNCGIRCFLVEILPDICHDDAVYIQVNNTLTALQTLVANYRSGFSLPVIGITGSNGKTIVKEWLYYLLSEQYSVIRSPKSYNSQIGVPLSVMLMQKSHNLAIFEAGISEPGEMENLQKIIKPTIGLFTNIGNAHQEFFTSINQKIYEKSKLFDSSDVVIYSKDSIEIDNCIKDKSKVTFTWSFVNKKYADINKIRKDVEGN